MTNIGQVEILGSTYTYQEENGVRTQISPLTGQVTTFFRTVHTHVINQTSIDTVALQNGINSGLQAQTINGYCDGITVVHGVITTGVSPSVWVAAASPIPIAIAAAIILLVKAILILIAVVVVYYLVTAIIEYLEFQPTYYFGCQGTGCIKGTWDEYVSYQNGHYWYVCSKDGAGFGSKATYSTIDQVPQTEVQAYHDHCINAADISPQFDWTRLAVIVGIGAVAVTGLVVASKLIPVGAGGGLFRAITSEGKTVARRIGASGEHLLKTTARRASTSGARFVKASTRRAASSVRRRT